MKTSEMFLQILNELKYIRETKHIAAMPKNVPEDHFIVYVTYENMLEQRDFRTKCVVVSQIYDGRNWEVNWQVELDNEIPQDRIFFLKRFDNEIEADEVIAWAKSRGYRPATHKEAFAFINEHSRLRNGEELISLGDYCELDIRRIVSAITNGISLSGKQYTDKFNLNNTFLLVKI